FVPALRRVAGGSGGTVAAIAGGRHDDVWISVAEGLVRVRGNGANQTFPWATPGEASMGVAAAADPNRGGLWGGFLGGGVAYFDDGGMRARYSASDGLGRGTIDHLRADADGTIWAATEGGLSRIKDGRVVTLDSRNGGLPCDAVLWSMPDDAGAV